MTIIDNIDKLFDENKPKEAHEYMLKELDSARVDGRREDELLLLNELIGYYRQTSEKDKLLETINATTALMDGMRLEGTVAYATSVLNIANAMRSIGELESANTYYTEVILIYEDQIKAGLMSSDDMRYAGLLNNYSLLLQEIANRCDKLEARKYLELAVQNQLKALEISIVNEAGFEIAVSKANLANSFWGLADYEQSEKYASDAVALFEARGLVDPHYSAALSALASCYIKKGRRNEGAKLLNRAMKIVEDTFGRNSQYERLKENLEQIQLKGLALSRKYYEEYGKPMIEAQFGEYSDKIAVGLVGEGSDCYGFDDELSVDHDFGPDFCLWVSDSTYEAIGEKLEKAYDNLPNEFEGYSRKTTAMGTGRRGVIRISDFYRRFLNIDSLDDILEDKLEYKNIPDYALSACVNGEVFRDDEGVFSSIREHLMRGFPSDIRLVKLAEDVAKYSQCGQYNYERMIHRGDLLTARMMLSDYCKTTLVLYHHLFNIYPPHDKWLVESTKKLPNGVWLVQKLNSIAEFEIDNYDEVLGVIEEIAFFLAKTMYDNNDISDVDSYLDHHIQELLLKAKVINLSKDDLVDRIARLEFDAFDKVKNEGGRASCQNDWPTFSVMRKSQYLTWNMNMLVQYFYDFTREYELGHNLITEKYGRMMESTAPERYEEIKDHFPTLSEEKKAVIETIVKIQMQMVEEFAEKYPRIAGNARDLHTYEDGLFNTSYETYLRGEISTYSDKMLQLYGSYVVDAARNGQNIAYMTIENTSKLYGYSDITKLENV